MKKHSVAFLIIVTGVILSLNMLVGCAGTGGVQSSTEMPDSDRESNKWDVPEDVAEIFRLWEEAIQTRNRKLLVKLLEQNAVVYFTERSGKLVEIHGFDAIAEFRLNFFQELGPHEEYQLGEMRWREDQNETEKSFGFHFTETEIVEWLHIQKKDRWYIAIVELVLPQPGSWVTNRYQAVADEDDDGFLDERERDRLRDMISALHQGPHEVASRLDEFFDENSDGLLDQAEGHRALEIHYRALRFFRDFQPQNAAHHLDLNDDGVVNDQELESIFRFMKGEEEISKDREGILHMAAWITFPDAVYQPVPRETTNLLDELADRNGDRIIDHEEQRIIMESLTPFHDVGNYLERAIDERHDGKVNSSEIRLLLQASALGRGLAAKEDRPPYIVRTFVDGLLDSNGDGVVDGEEVDATVAVLAGNLRLVSELSGDMVDLLDWNDDGRIEGWEIEETKVLLLFPRPVNPDEPLDRKSDINGDRHIDPEELGITAGVTSKGEIPSLEERIRIVRRRSGDQKSTSEQIQQQPASTGSSYYGNLGVIEHKKLAVVDLDVGTDKVDEETAKGISVFVENAFVNVGKVKVVDRAHIKQILAEHELQMSDIVDPTTAVKIGKIFGTDLIVIGSINRVGSLFYLNIKLIAVETAEIIGSSLSQASDPSGFLDMANEAVYRLF